MESKIKKTYLLIGLLTLLLSTLLTSWAFSRFYDNNLSHSLEEEGNMIAAIYEEKPMDSTAFFRKIALSRPKLRITWIDNQGNVLFESDKDKQKMDNHQDRPEVKEALEKGNAGHIRTSVTLSQRVYYYAKKLPDGSILRIARSQRFVENIIQNLVFAIIGIFLMIFILSTVLSSTLTKRILRPLKNMSEGSKAEAEVYPEIAPLFNRIKSQQTEIEKQLHHLEEEENKSQTIFQNMKEGMVLLSPQQQILSINKRALEIFGVPKEDYSGKNMLELTRNFDILSLLDKALSGESPTLILEEEGSYYEYHAAPAYDKEGEQTTCLLLILDITHRQKAEKMRREFTANVSHELKTPLTSIAGYAELMENNMVKDQDIPTFAGKIRQESHRLMNLIEDIIRLSHLDDIQTKKEYIPVNLSAEVHRAKERLEFFAEQKNVTIAIDQENSTQNQEEILMADPLQMQEMIGNLLDNAVKYNIQGGTVRVSIEKEIQENVYRGHGKCIKLTVEDSGIGIALRHQKRVFERFYRVDKSRSRQTGGTGLGLSIVSHIVKQHEGSIELSSQEGKGTVITVRLPLQKRKDEEK